MALGLAGSRVFNCCGFHFRWGAGLARHVLGQALVGHRQGVLAELLGEAALKEGGPVAYGGSGGLRCRAGNGVFWAWGASVAQVALEPGMTRDTGELESLPVAWSLLGRWAAGGSD